MEILEECGDELAQIIAEANEAEELLRKALAKAEASSSNFESCQSSLPWGVRNWLAQLHGNANKLLATRLDAIITSDLTTGRDEVRAVRKRLIKHTEEIIERLENLVKAHDRIKSAADR